MGWKHGVKPKPGGRARVDLHQFGEDSGDILCYSCGNYCNPTVIFTIGRRHYEADMRVFILCRKCQKLLKKKLDALF